VVTGAHTHNFNAIVTLLNEAHAIVQLPPLELKSAVEGLVDAFDDLLSNPSRLDQLGTRAQQLVAENRGATERTIEFLRPLLMRREIAVTKTGA
jgi:3-deoxy-D-manno-octulosonic-acid transferase